jgi:hypothetical protein
MPSSDQYIIYQPAKTAMQSGRKQTQNWLISSNNQSHRGINPLMGWTTSNSTKSQLLLKFKTKEQAINFAQQQNYQFIVIDNKSNFANLRPKSYSDNFLS